MNVVAANSIWMNESHTEKKLLSIVGDLVYATDSSDAIHKHVRILFEDCFFFNLNPI